MNERPKLSIYVRNAVFGIEDSLAATVGMLSGLASESVAHQQLIMTGVIYVFVEAVSMGIGSFLSEESAEEYAQRTTTLSLTIAGSLVMFIACIGGGFIPLIPYFFLDTATALPASIIFSVSILAIVGAVQAIVSKRTILPRIIRMVVLGGAAIAVGILVGKLFGTL